jgi:hypothetical protein
MKAYKGMRMPLNFMSQVITDGQCRVWAGPVLNDRPYVRIIYEGSKRRMINAKHVWWVCYGNPELKGRDELVSTCGLTLCVNPSHQKVYKKEEEYYARTTRPNRK